MTNPQSPAWFQGRATVTPRRVGLRQPRTWQVELVLEEDLVRDTALYFVYPAMQRQRATLQRERAGEDGYWWLEAPGLSFTEAWFQLSAFEVIRVVLTAEARAGACIRLNIVDTARLGRNHMGLRLHSWDALPFPVYMRKPGSEALFGLRHIPSACIEPEEPVILRCYAPSTVGHGAQTLRLRAAYLDRMLNPVPLAEAELEWACACDRRRFTVSAEAGALSAEVPICGCDEITIQDPQRGLSCRLNPRRRMEAGQPQLFWGEIHSHAHIDDGARDADHNFRYARNTACLDFAALTIHDHFAALVPGVLSQYTTSMWPLAEQTAYAWEDEFRAISQAAVGVAEGQGRWAFALAKTEAHNEPGRFVTLPAYEWTASTYKHLERATGVPGGHGHRCVYWNCAEPPLFCSRDPCYATPEQLFAALAPYKGRALTIPHHPAAHPEHKSGGWTMEWDSYDPEFDRLVEVFSCHGSSEYPGNPRPIPGKCGPQESFVRSAIGRGCTIGIVAGTDNHEARPGQVDGGWGDSPGGMIGVWAENLTREAIFDALYQRCCYGVSNMARIALDVRLNGAPMGAELCLPGDAKRELRIWVSGTALIEDIQVIKNGRPWRAWKLRGDRHEGEVVQTDDEAACELDSYYVTVLQRDGEMAWSSPIWVRRDAR